jgi:sugar phosphate permease
MGAPTDAFAASPAYRAAAASRVRYRVLGIACGLAVLTYIQRQGFIAASPFVKQDLGLNDEQMGYLAAVWLAAYGIFQIPAGFLVDRFGARRLLTMVVLGWSLTAGIVALIGTLPAASWLPFAALLLLRFLFGMFQAGGFPGIARIVADWMPLSQRGLAQGLIWTGSRLGGALAPLLLFWLLQTLGGWETPLWLMAGLGLVWCAVFWPWFRERPADMARVNAAEREIIESGRPVVGAGATGPFPWAMFWKSSNVWALCLMYGFVGFGGNFITNLLPIYLRDHRHLSDEVTAWLSGMPLACSAFSCLIGGALSDWLIRRSGSRAWGRRLVGCVGLSLAGLAVLSSIWAQQVWLLAFAFSAMFFFADANMGPAWAACADVGERYAGTLSGAMNMIGNLFGAAGMAFAGYYFHRGLTTSVFIAFAISYFSAALCWLAVDVTRPLGAKLP